MWQQGIIPESGMYYVKDFYSNKPLWLTKTIDEVNGVWYTWGRYEGDDPEWFGSTLNKDEEIDELDLLTMKWMPYNKEDMKTRTIETPNSTFEIYDRDKYDDPNYSMVNNGSVKNAKFEFIDLGEPRPFIWARDVTKTATITEGDVLGGYTITREDIDDFINSYKDENTEGIS